MRRYYVIGGIAGNEDSTAVKANPVLMELVLCGREMRDTFSLVLCSWFHMQQRGTENEWEWVCRKGGESPKAV